MVTHQEQLYIHCEGNAVLIMFAVKILLDYLMTVNCCWVSFGYRVANVDCYYLIKSMMHAWATMWSNIVASLLALNQKL